MPKSKLNTEQISGVLKQVEAGRSVAEMAREVGVSQHTIYAWKAKYGGMEVNEEKKLVADLSLDKDMLKSVIHRQVRCKRVSLPTTAQNCLGRSSPAIFCVNGSNPLPSPQMRINPQRR